MKASTFWKAVTVDREEFLEWFLDVLNAWGVRYCVIGGRGVNAYAEPVVSLDLDLVVAAYQLDTIKAALSESIPFLVDNAKRSPMLLTPRSLAVGRSRRSPAAVPRAAAAGVGTP